MIRQVHPLMAELGRFCAQKKKALWDEYKDLLRNGTFAEARPTGFAVMTDLGTVTVEIPGGLTEAHYAEFSPLLTQDQQGSLAKSVLENLLRLDFADWEALWSLCRQEFGPSEEDWLPGVVAENGFATVADKMRRALNQYRADNPRPRFAGKWRSFATPRWTGKGWRGCRLIFGNHEWTFRSDASTIIAILDALESNGWRPTDVMAASAKWLDEDNIRDTLHSLNEKTVGVLSWHRKGKGGVYWKAL